MYVVKKFKLFIFLFLLWLLSSWAFDLIVPPNIAAMAANQAVTDSPYTYKIVQSGALGVWKSWFNVFFYLSMGLSLGWSIRKIQTENKEKETK